MNRENIENIYRLSPVQQGMLFHTLYSPGEGVYFEQFNMVFGEDFDPAAFERMWQELIRRNPILRTSFAWEGLEEPVQIVHRQVEMPFEVLDWRGTPEAEHRSRLEAHAAAERRRGFELLKAPLMRFCAIRLRDDLWRVIWSYHHVILDGWSAGLLSQEVMPLYVAALTGKPLQAQQRRPFRDYVVWLRQQDYSQLEAYWRRLLGGFTRPTPLGIDRPANRGEREDGGRDMRTIAMPEGPTDVLKAFARQNRLTVSTVIQGAWAVVLSRYSGEDDVVFGLTVSGRPPSLPGVEAMLGCFINTLPVRVRLGDQPLLAWLQGFQADQIELRRYEHSPLVEVLGWSAVARPTPLFESILVMEGFMETSREGVFQRTNYPLTLVAGPDRELVLRADYERDRFDAATIDRLLGHLESVLAWFVAHPDRALAEIEILTTTERGQLLGVWNRPGNDFASPRSLHEIFEEQVARYPDRPAVTFEGESLTYGELNGRANRLAHHLRRLGVGPEARVGLCVDRSFEMIEGVLGILKAGGAYVPLDPRYPAARLSFIAGDSGLDVLVTTEPLRELVEGAVGTIVCLDSARPLLAAEPTDDLESGATPESLAYVIYTSGSTGRPKGSLVTHRNVARLFAATAGWFDFDEHDVWSLFHSFAFDFSVWEIWGALLHGGRLVVVPYWVSRSPEGFHELLARERVTVLNQTPSAFRQLVQADGEALSPPALSLRTVVFGGEALELSSLAPWFDRHGDEKPLLVNMYGITETTVHVTYREVRRADLAESGRSPIGEPIPDLAVHLRDGQGNLVPMGVPGEMYVGGAGVARGYLGRPDLTAERFVPDPFSSLPGARLYRSGDLARRSADGEVEYLGRIDHQVKIRGFRIELGEIEAAILAHPEVREAVVVTQMATAGDPRLVAYLVPREREIDLSSLRSMLKERLPDYMVPAAFVELGALPLTDHGKVDRRALPDPAAMESPVATGFQAPRTPLEEVVAAIWSEVLGVERVGREDNFFELGGHSLLATRVLSRLRETLGVELALRDLFEATTLVEQAGLAESALKAGDRVAMPPLRRVSRDGDIPLSFGQERFWFIDRLRPDSAAYNIPGRVRIEGRLDAPALRRAFAEVVRRHESLRTILPIRNGRPVQVILPGIGVLPAIDLSALPEPVRGAAARELVTAEALRPFDLATGPLVRFTLLRLAAGEHLLLITVHHTVSDGWSMGVMVREIGTLYGGFATGRPTALPELPLQYADFAVWQREWLQGEVLESQLAFWRARLAGAPPITLFPLDHPRTVLQGAEAEGLSLVLSAELTQGLKRLARRNGATLFMVLLAAFDALLLRQGAQEDLLIGSPIAGRSRVELEGLIGLFLNTLVLRVDGGGNPGFAALLGRARETTLSSYGHQDVPFEKLVEELAPGRNLTHTPFFQILLVLQNAPAEALELPGITLTPVAADGDVVKVDFTINAVELGPQLGIVLRYNRHLFDPATVERLGGHLERLFAAVLAEDARPVGTLPLLSVAEVHQLREWSATDVAYPPHLLLHGLVEAQVERTPETVAVISGELSLTYRELDRQANRLAHRLREAGVGPEVPVGVCAERSLEMVVALLAVLKAGGAYVPLDPSYPADRLAYMVATAGSPVLLVQPELAADLPEHGAQVLPLILGAGEDRGPAVAVDPDGLAYAIFTSGSTGRPKGAMNSHRGIVNRLLWMQETFGLDASDRVLQKTPFSFDVSVWEFFWPLMTGARLVMASPGGHQDPAYLVAEIARQGITTLHFVPSMLQVFLGARGVGECGSLRRVLCSGEALPADLVARFHAVLDVPLHNLYGPTEAAVDVSWWPCERGDERGSVPIGRPVANTSLHILDREGGAVPIGVAGELIIGGVQVGRGYLGRPDLTAERFVPDVFGQPGARAYRTGDLARFLPDGPIEFLGRLDHQVKIRGFRIELGEIESALAAQEGVREAVVVADRSTSSGAVGDWRLLAYVVPAASAALTADDLRACLGASLPEYMVPTAFLLLESLPLNPNGKVDRKALPAFDESSASSAAVYEAPRTALEHGLARLWSEALGGLAAERIGRRDSFFDLGGNSITGAIFINNVQEILGEIVHVVALFDAPVLADFASFLAREYGASVARVWGEPVSEPEGARGEALLTAEAVEQVRRQIRSLAPMPLPAAQNPPVLFVLSPPRSGSTLLRVMLGGHPALFAPPELELLNFNTLHERRDAFPGRDAFRLEGLLRAVMEVRSCGPEEARAIVDELTAEGATAQEAYRRMQEWIAPRLLVDKTPTYAWDPATLRRAENAFEDPRYLHLVRHPYGMIHSFEEARIDQIFFPEAHPFSRRQLAEALWGIAHANILEFLAEVSPERQLTVHFEDLLRNPERVLREICAFLRVPYHPEMAEPYAKTRERMTDGLYAESRMLGDVKFHEHGRVDDSVAERWREAYARDFLSEGTWRLAAELGYDVERERVDVATAPLERGNWREGEPQPLSFAQERLWFLDQLDPGTRTYNVSMGVQLSGHLDVAVLGGSLDEIARRHAALRTTFASRQGSPVQIVAPELRLTVPLVDLSALPTIERERAAIRAVTASSGEPFDLSSGPLLRALLVRLGQADHIAAFTAHHVVCDGWSLGVLVREVAALYSAAVEGRPSPLPPLTVQYVDFARWQRQWLTGAALGRQLDYWRRQLAGVPVLQLPSDRPRPGVQSYLGSTRGFTLSPELSAGLRALSREAGATSFMTVLAGFQALLSRVSGQEDFAVGSPIAGRNRRELEPLIGFFVNTLVLRTSLAGEPDGHGLLERVRRVALEAYGHQDVPFERLVQEVAPERNLSYSPLFQVLLAFQNAPTGRLELPGLTLAPVTEEFSTSKFDISLTVFDSGPQIFGQWVYSTALFEGETIARWAGHLTVLLEGLAADPGRRIAELPLLDDREREQILVEWNRPPAEYPDEGFVHQLFEAQAGKTPDKVALVFEGESLSYRELNARANRLARRLRRLGVGPEAVVGISAERSFEMVVGLLGILKAGGAYLPLDPSLPAERLAFMMTNAGVDLLLAQERLLPDLPVREGIGIVPLDTPEDGDEPAGNLDVPMFSGNPAYLIYTSGSTGVPKGVVVSHRALGNRLQYARAGDVRADDAFLQKTTISFDVSLLEIFAPLVIGGRVVLAKPGGQQDTAYLVRLIREQRITYTSFPPSLLYVLFEQEELDRCDSLRTVITGGETVPAVLPGQFYERLPAASLLNRYGPTEATISVTSWLCEREGTPRSLPIGRPTAKARVYLVDRALQPVPAGIAGELLLGGLCLARGYHGQPALTAGTFIPDPFSEDLGERLYRTGDLARYRPDGAVEFVGRVDSQVKIRGFRVELGEIEAALARHPAVREAAVIDRQEGASRSLAAYVVLDPQAAPDESELRRFLAETLPAYMMPADFVTMPALPLSPTGKVDRRALPEPGQRRSTGNFAAPRGPVEEILADIWTQVLGQERVSRTDDFFAIGGHSLLATRIVARVRDLLGFDLPLRLLFENPTIASLAGEIQRAGQTEPAGGGLAAPPITRVPRQGEIPLSFAQERLWFLDQFESTGSAYNIPLTIRLRGALDPSILQRSLAAILSRHEVLRTSFTSAGGRAVQVIAPEADPGLVQVDLRALTAERREGEVRRLARDEARRPFDLSRLPLLRFVLLSLADEEHVALFTLHHVIADLWSMGIFLGELTAQYGALSQGLHATLPELPVQYADYASWQRSWLVGEVLESELAYWRRRLAGAPAVLELPTDRPRPAVQSFQGGRRGELLAPELLHGFQAISRENGATLFMTLLAAIGTLLSRYSAQDDVVLGTPVANRDRLEVEGLIGFFLNTLALRIDLTGDLSFAELLRRVRRATLEDFAHQDLPFEMLVDELVTGRDLATSPLFQVMVVVQNAAPPAPVLPGIGLERMETDVATAKFDLTFSFIEGPAGLLAAVDYSADLFEAATIDRLLGHLGTLFAGIAAGPESPLSDLPLLTAREREQALVAWNRTQGPAAAGSGLLERIEEQVERTPDAVAVDFGGERLSYRELNAWANRLAHRLTRLGVRPGGIVAICAERSVEMVVAVLATLKAGAAYTPVDPAYPADRQAFMLADSGASALLTQERLAATLPGFAGANLNLDADRGDLAAESDANPPRLAGGDDLAYVIYTSGSTGRPKGVAMIRRALSNLLDWQERISSLRGPVRTVQLASLSFDVSFQEIFSTWRSGGTLHLITEEQRRDATALLDLLVTAGIERLFLPFVALRNLAEVAESRRTLPASLREVITAGEQLQVTAQIAAWFERLPDCRLHNQYGPSETHVATGHVLSGPPPQWPVLPPIGVPISNTRAHILDRQGHPAPVGVPGELYLGGACLARGYVDRPGMTAEKFVPDPFAALWGEAGARLYRTGDLARYRPDGEIDFLGRIDQQVKVRGFRIELGEIEAVLAAHEDVAQAAVVARPDPSGAQRLIAYVVPAAEAPAPARLRAFLESRLPEHMVPSLFLTLEALPLTPSGKLDRRSLPSPDASRLQGEIEYVAPRTPMEELVADLWLPLLGVDRVGAQDDFFTLGGHSLLATQLVSRLREAFGVELPLRRVFERSTLAALAAEIEGRVGGAGGFEAPPLRPMPRQGDILLSFAQERLWFIDQLQPGSPAYNMPAAVRLGGALDVTAFRRGLQEIADRHEALRTTFLGQGGRPLQRIAAEMRLDVPVVDLRSLPSAEREAAVRRLATEEARRPFDLATGPLLRATLLRSLTAAGEEEHVVLLTMHHIISDGWSIGVLIREITALYGAFVTGEPSPLPRLPIQYADYAQWQRGWLAGDVLADQLAYWRRRLGGAPPLLELPIDRPRPAVQRLRGGQHRWMLPAALSTEFKTLCRGAKGTLFMGLLSTFQILLQRHTASDDLIVGTPVAGRDRLETEGLIGLFLNSLALRTSLAGNPDFRGLLARTRETTLEAFAHQDLPFEKIVEELAPERNLSYSPLFQVMLVLQNTPAESLEMPGLTLAPVSLEEGSTAKFDLNLAVNETPQGLAGVLGYNADLFEAATIARMLGHFQTLIAGITAEPGRPISDLPLLTPAEERQLRDENAAWVAHPTRPCLHERIESQAAKFPERIAVSSEAGTLTYRELNAAANRLAWRLIDAGVGPEVVVGVHAERSLAMMMGLLAVLKAGGAYLPLDPEYPAERLAFMVRDSGVGVLLTTEGLAGGLPAREALRTVLLEGVLAGGEDPGNPRAGATPDNLAYVIYTSGSTGRPKGSLIPHGAAVRLFTATEPWFHFDERDVWTLFHSFAFDFSVWEIFGALLYGGRLVVVPYWISRSPRDFRQLLAREGVTVLNQTPSAFRQLAQADAEAPATEPLDLRLVIFGGEALDPSHLASWFGRHGDERPQLVNMYGITETTVHVTYRPLAAADLAGAGRSPIGEPIPDLRVHLLDRWGNPSPLGVAGEMLVMGPGLARGYLGRPDLTAERFVPDPFGTPGGRLYRSGDLARKLPDGGLEYLGRIDLQVKIRGFRIELGEIEATLRAHPAVAAAAVLVREDQPGDRRLVAYFVPRAAAEDLPADELRAFLRDRLPDYMVPAALVRMTDLPLNENGKLDRRALPVPEWGGGAERFEAARTPVEELLAEVWAGLLAVERVGLRDNFFDLGGHSLLATQVVSRVREIFGVELPLRVLFEKPTIGQLAPEVEAAASAGGPQAPPLVRMPREGDLPLSFAQERLWFLDRMEPDSPLYNLPFALRLQGPLDAGLFRASLREVARRHEALRTTFAWRGDRPVQIIGAAGTWETPVVDLASLPAARRDEAAIGLVGEEVRRPFDLAAGPLVRCHLLRLAADEHVVVIAMHHIVSDGWSMTVFIREFGLIYQALLAGAPSPLPDLAIQYGDYALWQRSWLRGAVLEEQIDFWRRTLRGAATLELPADRPRPPVQTHRGGSEPFSLSADLFRGLTALARAEGVTSFMTLLAAFSAVLSRYSGQPDVPVGSPIANRTRAETEGLIGFFANTLVLRVDLAEAPAFRELLARVREITLAAYAHQELPFERVVEEVNPQRDLSRTPLFQVLLALLNVRESALDVPGLSLSPFAGVEGTVAKFDLALWLREGAGSGIAGSLEFNRDLFDRATVARLVGHLRTLLAAAVEAPERPFSELPLLSDGELLQIADGNATAIPFSAGSGAHQLFEAWAERTPEAVAAVFQGRELTYRELNERANRLAHHLRSLGVGVEDRVGFCLDRSPRLLIAVLAVMKSGGTYVPLDPKHPRERLAYVLDDTRAGVVLTEAAVADLLEGLLPATARAVLLDEDAPDATAIAAAPATDPDPLPLPADRLAYIIYTSGSTGRPKGVQVPHQALVNFLESMASRPGMAPEDVWLAITTLSFDMAVPEVLLPLITGARLVIAPAEAVADGEALAHLLASSGATILQATPTTWRLLLEAGWRGTPGLRGFIGAEAVLREVADRLLDLGVDLWTFYGPTETTVWSTATRVERAAGPVPLGDAFANTQVYVLDRAFQLLPAGAPGECYIGGTGVTRGYFGQPGLTAERYLPDPFASETGARMYRTGDLVRRRADGVLEFLGRADFQVKIRGFRIELGEIEEALARCPDVRRAVILAREDVPGDKRLVAYVVPRDTASADPLASFDPAGPRRFLRERLPEYMMPAAWVVLAELPLTPNGKVDRKALPVPEGSRAGWSHASVPPRTEEERVIAALWGEALRLDRVGVQESFFELGGHSLLLAQLHRRLRERFERELSVIDLFRYATVESLAAFLGPLRQREITLPPSLVELQPRGSKPPLFLVHPLSGELLLYRHLVSSLGAEQPVYGFQARGFGDGLEPLSRVEDMASLYVESLLAFRPQGPYLLAGSSFGGLIAYEVASRLRALGREVALVALLDVSAPGPSVEAEYDGEAKGELAIFNYVTGGDPTMPLERLRTLAPEERLELILQRGRENGAFAASFGVPELRWLVEVVSANQRAIRAYVPAASDLRVTFLHAAASESSAESWSGLALGGVEVHEVPGNHLSLHFPPQVEEAAAALRSCIEGALRTAGGDSPGEAGGARPAGAVRPFAEPQIP
ncbi:MAG TPA: non-ribosomal peptide synthase/polyketide synthase [Thermoanaerobaculia bacterium]|nr:non-ribosomal peptide synthase/polyketide synthase [Thermoanaerobaculia bacterium]